MGWLDDFGIRSEDGADPPVVVLTGDIDRFVLSRMTSGVRSRMDAAGGGEVRVDLSGVPFIDGAGMYSLIDLTEEGDRIGCRLIIRDPSGPVQRLIDLVDRDHRLTVERSERPERPERSERPGRRERSGVPGTPAVR